MLSGLVWGACIGFYFQRSHTQTDKVSPWMSGIIGLALLVIVTLVSNIVILQARLIPDFSTYAREWDARHHRIIQLRDNGEQAIVVTAYSYHMTEAISPFDLEIVGSNCQAYYYGVESISEP